MGRVTISDVAKRAGVSTSTVSRTFHDNPRITPETKQRVLDAARQLGYRPSVVGAPETVRSVALMLPNNASDLLRHPFFVRVMRGISLFAQSHGFLTTYAYASEQSEQLRILEQCAGSSSVSGAILLSVYRHDPCVQLLVDADVPFSIIGRPESAGSLLWVDNDNFHAMYDAVNHLIEQGARSLAFLGGPREMNVTRDRLEGYRRALSNRGIEPEAGLVFHADEFTRRAGFEGMRTLLESARPEALVATDDFLALGALEFLRDRTMHIPCIGFNNLRESVDFDPPLSSVEINPEELGSQAARLLIASIDDNKLDEDHVIVPTSLIQRQSSALVPV